MRLTLPGGPSGEMPAPAPCLHTVTVRDGGPLPRRGGDQVVAKVHKGVHQVPVRQPEGAIDVPAPIVCVLVVTALFTQCSLSIPAQGSC